MKKFLLIAVALLVGSAAFAQNDLGSTDDLGRISLNAMIAPNCQIPANSQKMMLNKLNQIATKNGIGGLGTNTRFVITANAIEVGKEVTPTAPPMVALVIEPTLYIGDIETGNLFASVAIGSMKSAGQTEDKAWMQCIKNIKPDSPQIQKFVEQGKTRIIEYYNSQIDFMLSKAESLASADDYDGAICLLMEVPEVCKDAYMKAMAKCGDIYQQKIDKESAIALQKAKNAWNANQSWDGAMDAAYWLDQVDPYSSSANAANTLGNAIAKRIKEVDKREWDFKVKCHNDNVSLEKARINAAAEIGKARAKQQITYYNNVRWW